MKELLKLAALWGFLIALFIAAYWYFSNHPSLVSRPP